ncbi:MAG: 23S rRNA (adenine(2503)-C(2))-methyltransferase RlmN [Lachnospiraceae bacterium]|jgi:23S rRNA (adenine2503-C2)-methyltransferase|nr:23S rRNA (adenine(2503)-C(2))-methyltransferase RlmN [Lachnospiraceae bacterium]
MSQDKQDILKLSEKDLKDYFVLKKQPGFRAKQVYLWLHEKLVDSFDDMTNISKDMREMLKEDFYIEHLELVQRLVSNIDGTEKYLFKLWDGNVIESVLMRYKHGNSVCISTQVGCRMGCRFCASTIDGRARDLTSSEMLKEVYTIQNISGERVSNIVLMGSGEPMDNFRNVVDFVKQVSSENDLHISQRNITISTCGLVEKIRELADMKLGITLAISLHASDDKIRRELMPIANKYSIAEILDACRYYFEKTGRRVSFEYSLVASVNDTIEEADNLASLLKGMNCHVNLIPVNPIKERDYKRSDKKAVEAFRKHLEKKGINATVRREMGSDIQGACGQLRKSYLNG